MVVCKKYFTSFFLFILIATTFLATPDRVLAASIQVNTYSDQNNTDPSHCSLREAIVAANTNNAYGGCPGGSGTTDTIFLSGGTYILSLSGGDAANLGDLVITEGVTISGVGFSTIVSGKPGWADRIFHVKSGGGNVSISNMTIQLGNASLIALGGGAILNDKGSVLSLSNVKIYNNGAGTLTGGGITNLSTARLTIKASIITANTALSGGGIYNGGTLTMTTSLLSSNSLAETGGGLDNRPLLTAEQIDKGATIINSTITQNSAGLGAGVYTTGPLTVINNTIVNNFSGEGLLMTSTSSLTIQNTIIGYHAIGSGVSKNCLYEGTVAPNSLGYNLEDNHVCKLSVSNHDRIDFNTGPLLKLNTQNQPDLTANGGPTDTIALMTNSLAVDDIPSDHCPYSIDQRLYGRGVDGNEDGTAGCDIGAFEVGGRMLYLYLPNIKR